MLDMLDGQQKAGNRPLQETEINRAKRMGVALSRRRREFDFTLFRQNAASFFNKSDSDEGHKRMADRAGYVVQVPGDDVDPAEARLVEVSYGAYDAQQLQGLKDERLKSEWDGAEEAGAALFYAQGGDGAVTAFLYPARMPGMKAEEDAIILARYADNNALTGEGLLERHWKMFRSYAEVTAFEGEPTLFDHARVAWLRLTRPVIRDGRRHRSEALRGGVKLAGVSGAIVMAAAFLNILA